MKFRDALEKCSVGEGVSMKDLVDLRDSNPDLFPPCRPDCNGVDDITCLVDPDSEPLIFSPAEVPVSHSVEFVWVRVA